MSKTMLEILAADAVKNPRAEPRDLGKLHQAIMEAVEDGSAQLHRELDTIFVVHGNEWHTFHGGSTADIVEATLRFLKAKAGTGVPNMVTYYGNPKISTLVSHIPYKTQVAQVDEGTNRTFKLSVEF